MPKLALIFPRFRYPSGDFPIGIALLAAYVQQELEWEVEICDTTFQPELRTIEKFLRRFKPDVVGVGMSTLMLGEGLAACRLAKEQGCPVFVGGPHPTTAPEEMMQHPCIDAVVIGEGEQTTVTLLPMLLGGNRAALTGAWIRDVQGNVHPSNQRQPIEHLDDLPFPAWELIDMDAYIDAWGQLDSIQPGLRGVNITAARGCPFICSFCQPVLDSMFGKRLRQRSPESVVMELQELKQRYGINAFWFTDDTFTTNRKWVRAFCKKLHDSELNLIWGCTTRANLIPEELMQMMVSAGLRKLGIGLESATDHIREELYKKGVSDHAVEETVRTAAELKVQVLLFLMLGAPGESREDMWKTIKLASRLPAAEASFSLFVPIPGTELYTKMKDAGIELSSDYIDYDYYARQPFEHDLSRRELRMIQRLAYLCFYTHPQRWAMMSRLLTSGSGLRSLGRKIRRILPQPSHPHVSA